MRRSDEHSAPVWEVHVYREWRPVRKPSPGWASPWQREKWSVRRLVLCDHQASRIAWLAPTTAVCLLNQLRTTADWKEQGFVVEEPAMGFSLNDPEQKPCRTLLGEMILSPQQLQELLQLLEGHAARLQQLHEEQERKRRWRIGQAYDIILKCGR